jgi:hypothetical protein
MRRLRQTLRIQALQQFARLARIYQFAAARGFHSGDGFGVGIERLEGQRLFRRYAYKQETKGVGQREPYFFQRSKDRRFPARASSPPSPLI